MPTIPEARLGEIALQPQARVRDDYIPARAAGPSLGMQLAESLAAFQPAIQGYLRKKQAKLNEAAEAQARKDALTEAQQDIKEVQAGTKFAQQSRVYKEAYLGQRGLIEGQRIRSDAIAEYQAQGLENSTDPKEFDEFLSGFLKTRLEGITDPFMLKGALGVVEQSANNLSLENAAKVSKNIQAGIVEDATVLIGTALENEAESALREKRAFDPAAVMGVVNASNARTKFLQLPGADFRKRVTDLVIDKAVREADPSVLAVLDQQMDVGGKKVPLADAYWKAVRDDVIVRVQSRQTQISDQLAQEEARAQKQRLQQGQSALLKAFATDPYALPSAAQLAEWEDYAPGLGEQALTIRSKLIEAREKSSPASTLAAMEEFVRDPADLSKLFGAVRSGRVDPSMLRWGLTTFEKASKLGQGDAKIGWKSVQNNPAVAPFMARFDAASTDPILKELTLNPATLADARSEFNLSILEYIEANPQASFRDLKVFTRQVFNDITSSARESMAQGKSLDAVRTPANPKTPAASATKPEAPTNAFAEDVE